MTENVLEVAELRAEGHSYPTIAKRLSIALSTAHYRQSRYEQASEPIPFLRVGCGCCAPRPCASTSLSDPPPRRRRDRQARPREAGQD